MSRLVVDGLELQPPPLLLLCDLSLHLKRVVSCNTSHLFNDAKAR
jgi:hypothetical protein